MRCSGKIAQADASHTAAQTVRLAGIALCSVQCQKDASPGRGGGGVAIALKGLEHGQRLLGAQLQRLADLVDDRLAAAGGRPGWMQKRSTAIVKSGT